MSALNLLSGYNSDSSDESDTDECTPSKLTKSTYRLPLPSILKCDEQKDEVKDDPELHGGRKRSYPHERGNWNSLIYISYEPNESFDIFLDNVIEKCLPDLELSKIEKPHISLSRTFVLYYHWINEFNSSLRDKLKVIPRYVISFDGIGIYCNEERTRTFFALTVGKGSGELSSSISIIDNCLKDYKLNPFYEEASFHMSIAWCLEDKEKILLSKLPEFIKLFEFYKESANFSLAVHHYLLKTGYKEFKFHLK